MGILEYTDILNALTFNVSLAEKFGEGYSKREYKRLPQALVLPQALAFQVSLVEIDPEFKRELIRVYDLNKY